MSPPLNWIFPSGCICVQFGFESRKVLCSCVCAHPCLCPA
ncbi:hypothetical protein M6B38_153860 [Iris pallida]|uniref:Uncharacterized protein n=1 Tax=Iris pallida TaxID=29817 RepID=A0AAX6F5Z6_IRIPA|nr:hypothetical protein M6B38_153860 [Iris pallida]